MSDNFKIMVYIVDDDESVCASLSMLMYSVNMNVQSFRHPNEFMNCQPQLERSCLITDIEMKGMDGFDLQIKLRAEGIDLPTIFLTASDSDENRQRAKQNGAIGYLTKPVDDQALLDSIHWALSSGTLPTT